jgi:uncharacterized protein (DUF302 family)
MSRRNVWIVLALGAPILAGPIVPMSRGSWLVPRNTREGESVNSDNGVVTVPSRHSVDQTVETLEAALRAKGIKLFAVVDHSGEARAVGLLMRPTKLLIFGNPKAGTPLMTAAPSIAIDLPLKLLVWEDAISKVWISYNTPSYLERRHHLPRELVPTLAAVEALATKAGE